MDSKMRRQMEELIAGKPKRDQARLRNLNEWTLADHPLTDTAPVRLPAKLLTEDEEAAMFDWVDRLVEHQQTLAAKHDGLPRSMKFNFQSGIIKRWGVDVYQAVLYALDELLDDEVSYIPKGFTPGMRKGDFGVVFEQDD